MLKTWPEAKPSSRRPVSRSAPRNPRALGLLVAEVSFLFACCFELLVGARRLCSFTAVHERVLRPLIACLVPVERM